MSYAVNADTTYNDPVDMAVFDVGHIVTHPDLGTVAVVEASNTTPPTKGGAPTTVTVKVTVRTRAGQEFTIPAAELR